MINPFLNKIIMIMPLLMMIMSRTIKMILLMMYSELPIRYTLRCNIPIRYNEILWRPPGDRQMPYILVYH